MGAFCGARIVGARTHEIHFLLDRRKQKLQAWQAHTEIALLISSILSARLSDLKGGL
jgi:hypothetical protein